MNDRVANFCKLWPEELAALLRQMGVAGAVASGTEPRDVEAATQELLSKGVCARFMGGVALKGELAICTDTATALALAQAFMSEALDPAIAFADSHRDAFLELVRQVAGVVATDWKQEAGKDVVLSFHSATEPPFVVTTEVTIEVKGETLPACSLKLELNKAMAEALEVEPPTPAATPPLAAAAPASVLMQTSQPALPTAAVTSGSANLDLLLDVELEATIRFGEREMLLKEIYGLMPGTVIELDQMINEPAQLLVAGRTVAWGEVVVVDGNFGLRVTQVASKMLRAEAASL